MHKYIMILTEKQKTVVQDLQSQEELCIQKYGNYGKQAKDQELKNLFNSLKEEEQEHYNSLSQLLTGTCPSVNSSTATGKDYNPTASYSGVAFNQEDKTCDQFLCTDCIATEKYVSSAYNNDLFQFAEPEVRKLLNHIQTEEQVHAEKIYKYKTVNNMQ